MISKPERGLQRSIQLRSMKNTSASGMRSRCSLDDKEPVLRDDVLTDLSVIVGNASAAGDDNLSVIFLFWRRGGRCLGREGLMLWCYCRVLIAGDKLS